MKLSNLSLLLCFLFFTAFICDSHAQNFSDEQKEMLKLVNNLRAQEGASPLQLNTSLNTAAFDHSKDMGENNYFSHTGQNGSTFGERARNTGYEGFPDGENIAAGGQTVSQTFNQWVNSSGHKRNMVNTKSNELGIGHAIVSGTAYTHYWTMILGSGDGVLSTKDIVDTTTDFRVYPNPASSFIQIQLNKGSKVLTASDFYLTTITGQVIERLQSNLSEGVLEMNIEHIPSGIYFLKTEGKMGVKVVKT